MSVRSWLLEVVSGLLEPDERAAVRGDLIELGQTDRAALLEVSGLVVRRYAAAWFELRPWIALAVVVVPVGVVLSIASRWWAYGSIDVAWLWVHSAEWSYFQNPGWRGAFVSSVVRTPLDYLTLVCWSWTTGFVLASLSHRAAWMNGGLFGALLFLGTMGTTTAARSHAVHAAELTWMLSEEVLPAAVRTVVVMFPLALGVRRGQRGTPLPLIRTSVWALVALVLTLRAIGMLENAVIFGWRPVDEFAAFGFRPVPFPRWLAPGPDGFVRSADDVVAWPLRLLPAIVFWPTLYTFVLMARQRMRGNR